MSDHEQCDDRIAAALSTGNPGFAEYLATRCDLWHRRTNPTPDPVQAAGTPQEATSG